MRNKLTIVTVLLGYVGACKPSVNESEMREVPGGSYVLGCNGRLCLGRGVTEASVETFWIDATEVTTEQYEQCVASSNCGNDRKGATADVPALVHWEDANRYCRWKKKELPSRDQWEAAGRGKDQRAYPWGDVAPPCEIERACSHGVAKLATVGTNPLDKSPYGVMDMWGNAPEWAEHRDGDLYFVHPESIYPFSGATKIYDEEAVDPKMSYAGFRCVSKARP